jgi:hypothetical protein
MDLSIMQKQGRRCGLQQAPATASSFAEAIDADCALIAVYAKVASHLSLMSRSQSSTDLHPSFVLVPA